MEKERCPIMESDAQNWEAEFDPGLERGLGIYGRKGLDYLKNYRPAVYREMQEGAFLRRHLEETDRLAYTTQLREIMNEAAELKENRAYIEEQRQNNAQAVQRIEDAAAAMEQASCHICEWDETLIRQLVDTVKVHSAEKITVYLRGGVQVDQDMI